MPHSIVGFIFMILASLLHGITTNFLGQSKILNGPGRKCIMSGEKLQWLTFDTGRHIEVFPQVYD